MAEQWLGIPAAAKVLGVDAASVRKQIAEETLTLRQGERGLEVLVTVADEQRTPETAPADASGPVGREAVFEAMLASEADEADARIATGATGDDDADLTNEPALRMAVAVAGPAYDDRADSLDLMRERLAHARAESHRLRQTNRFALASVGVTLIAGVLLATNYAVDASRAEGALLAHRELVDEAKSEANRVSDGLLVMKRENAALTERLASVQAERDAARRQLDEQGQRLTDLTVQKRQAETALQAALVSLYQHQPEAARVAVEQLRAGVE